MELENLSAEQKAALVDLIKGMTPEQIKQLKDGKCMQPACVVVAPGYGADVEAGKEDLDVTDLLIKAGVIVGSVVTAYGLIRLIDWALSSSDGGAVEG